MKRDAYRRGIALGTTRGMVIGFGLCLVVINLIGDLWL